MNKAMAFGFFLLFATTFIMIQESLGYPPSCFHPDTRPQCNSGRYKRGICVAARRLDCEQILRDENANPRVQETAK
ncbi:hypothetical protein ACROYT_G041477 [Oculina patagonica]